MSLLTEHLNELIRACFTGIWIRTHEHFDVTTEIAQLCRNEGWSAMDWDIAQGLQVLTGDLVAEASDPLGALRALGSVAAGGDKTAILLLNNFHRFLGSAEVIQTMSRMVHTGKGSRAFIVILAPVVQLPPELERLFVVIDHQQPSKQDLQQLMEEVATEPGEAPTPDELPLVLDAATGLTRYEAENAYSLSLVRHGSVQAQEIWNLKAQTLKKSGLLTVAKCEMDFSSLGGLSSLKSFTKRALLRARASSVKPRGILLLSPPGCGKSEFCRALGKETGRPVLVLDVGTLMSSLVGQSEERTREALKIIDSMAPCIVMIDEVEKAFAGVAGSSSGDSGVSSRMFGTFLTWLNDHTSDVFVVCTSNDIAKLPPEFSRAERFDGLFFIDLPAKEQRNAIWQLYREYFGIDDDEAQPSDEHWTGAEIRSCCRLAALLDIPLAQAAMNVVPIAMTAGESIQRLRSWASGRCLDSDHPGIFSEARSDDRSPSRRRVSRSKPSEN